MISLEKYGSFKHIVVLCGTFAVRAWNAWTHAENVLMESPLKSIVFVVVCFVCYSAALELLVLPEGEEHSVLCTVADEYRFEINWVVDGGAAGEEFVVGDEETLQDGTKITFNATLDVNNTNVKCTVLDRVTPALSFDSVNFTIIIQGSQPHHSTIMSSKSWLHFFRSSVSPWCGVHKK